MDERLAFIELEKAQEARQNGNEGMGRVLARRAAGLAIREYLEKLNFDQRGLSLNALIKDIEVRNLLPVSTHIFLDHLSTRVNMDFQLPVDFDLLMDAEKVIEQLSIDKGENE